MAPTTPWVSGPLSIPRSALDAIDAHARETYPSEACGFISGPANEPALADEVTRETNQADRYHALDPAHFPRTSRTYFKIDELRAARTFRACADSGRPVKVIYHSHCDASARFSEEDASTFSHGGVLMWPCAFLVVSVGAGEVRDRKLWVHRAGTDEFDESPLEVL